MWQDDVSLRTRFFFWRLAWEEFFAFTISSGILKKSFTPALQGSLREIRASPSCSLSYTGHHQWNHHALHIICLCSCYYLGFWYISGEKVVLLANFTRSSPIPCNYKYVLIRDITVMRKLLLWVTKTSRIVFCAHSYKHVMVVLHMLAFFTIHLLDMTSSQNSGVHRYILDIDIVKLKLSKN